MYSFQTKLCLLRAPFIQPNLMNSNQRFHNPKLSGDLHKAIIMIICCVLKWSCILKHYIILIQNVVIKYSFICYTEKQHVLEE